MQVRLGFRVRVRVRVRVRDRVRVRVRVAAPTEGLYSAFRIMLGDGDPCAGWVVTRWSFILFPPI